MKLDALENEIDELFEYMKTDNKGMENSVYHFIDDLYESLERISEYSDDFQINFYYSILEHMRREISSELRYIKFDSDDNSIPNSFFQEMFVRYKIEHLVIELIDILSDGEYGYLRCYHSNLPVKYLLSVNFDDEELSVNFDDEELSDDSDDEELSDDSDDEELSDDSDDEELSDDFDVEELMDGVIEIEVCEECYNYFYFCIFDFEFDLSEWMHINHLGRMKITPLTFNSTEM